MKEHGNKHPAEVPPTIVGGGGTRTLKSLLKKPGQTKSKGSKNRVVINEKLNEFFAADYIILIKEECCGSNDYEEDCDCCCQEHEMIRLGSCKECRAELNLHFGADGRASTGGIGVDIGAGGGSYDDCDGTVRGTSRRQVNNDRYNDEQEDEDDDEDDEEEDDDEDEEEEIDHQRNIGAEKISLDGQDIKKLPSKTRHRVNDFLVEQQQQQQQQKQQQQQQQQQHETLSPPEGYKDDSCLDNECSLQQPISSSCSECNYYQQQHEEKIETDETSVGVEHVAKESNDKTNITGDEDSQENKDPTSDSHQRYLVETITMTTVTERRIVREINEEENETSVEETTPPKTDPTTTLESSLTKDDETNPKEPEPNQSNEPKSSPDLSELSLTFKLSNVSSLMSNSLQKPNSAVRQLFPDPRFISPPPAPSGKTLSSEDCNSEAQKFLITTESLRMFDAVKRNKLITERSDSSESEPTTMRRTIERNNLRRSLIGKYDGISASRKKNLRTKDLSLEERIKRLTCIDQDEENGESSSTASDNTINPQDDTLDQFPIRTSPSGEEHPTRNDSTQEQQLTHRRLSDLFNQKPLDRINSDVVRRQFLSTLTPLSCVTDTREDYYRMSSKLTTVPNRDSAEYHSDSSYSLEDIESVLKNESRINPTGISMDSGSVDQINNADEQLLAFVEQDKSRTERIKRRYNDSDNQNKLINGVNVDGNNVNTKIEDNDEDDELNDYGFNRRPSVRGIKPFFPTTTVDEINQPFRTDVRSSWPTYYEKSVPDKIDSGLNDSDVNTNIYGTICNEGVRDNNTINRINTMQKQIDDIYQTIAETTSVAQGNLDGSTTLPRSLIRIPLNPDGSVYQDPSNARMLRIAGGGCSGNIEDAPTTMYTNTLPIKNRRYPMETMSNYQCNTLPNTANSTKCYRTMYFVPYNSLSDPTYQNIQRILTPHPSPNYATHIERYPYPRPTRPPDPQQPPPRYYPRSLPSTSNNSSQIPPPAVPPQTLHLHLHHHQPDDYRIPGSVPLQLQHHRHHHPLMPPYHHVQQQQQQQQSAPSYTVIGAPRCATTVTAGQSTVLSGIGQGTTASGYQLYQLHLARTATDVQTQTISSSMPVPCVPLLSTTFNNGTSMCNVTSSYASPLISSPTKLQRQPLQMNSNTCNVAERGVPEGAASVPPQDFLQPGVNATAIPNSQLGITSSMTYVDAHQINGVSTASNNTVQNSVYYAMNV